jgi:NADH-quinone oxidoreductase subunit N
MNEQIADITTGLRWILPEISLAISFLTIIFASLFKIRYSWLAVAAFLSFFISIILTPSTPFGGVTVLFNGMLQVDSFSIYLKLLMDIAGIFTVILSLKDTRQHGSEFLAFLVVVVLGSHLLAMTTHYLVIFLAIEVVSLGSYVLAGFSFSKTGTEGSLKYFLFGAVASAVMLYGFSILYGLTGSLSFGLQWSAQTIDTASPGLFLLAVFFVFAGFLYKVAAFPMHVWSPDVYEGAPLPVLAFLSVVPKVAGFAVLIKWVSTLHAFDQSGVDWQMILAVIAIFTLTAGNFSALVQQSPKRMMAYSSIAQSGFLLVGVVAMSPSGKDSFLFYTTLYMVMNFAVIACLQFFEGRGFTTIADFKGSGKQWVVPSLALLVGLIALTGLPPTAGFTAKLFVFSSLWQAYELTDKPILLVLMIFGLVNTVISLFYYLRIPYFAYLKSGQPADRQNIVTSENLLAVILVVVILMLFFLPGLLMGWINKINFVV